MAQWFLNFLARASGVAACSGSSKWRCGLFWMRAHVHAQTFQSLQPEAGLTLHHFNPMLLRNQPSATLSVRYYQEE